MIWFVTKFSPKVNPLLKEINKGSLKKENKPDISNDH